MGTCILVTEDCDCDENRLYLKLVSSGRKKKTERKVSRYRDKKGIIAKEQEEASNWIKNIFENDTELILNIKTRYLCNITKKCKNSSRKRYITRGCYLEDKIISIITRNRCYIQKKRRYDGLVYFKTDDIFEFLTLLYTSYNMKSFQKFIDVPDVSYVLRQIKKTGIEIYLRDIA